MQDFPADRKQERKDFNDRKKPKSKTKSPVTTSPDSAVDTNQEISKEMDIFFRTIQDFIPEGKTWDELTAEEQEIIKNQYRFDYLKPGCYQNITGFSNMI